MKFVKIAVIGFVVGTTISACSETKKDQFKPEKAPTVPTVNPKGLKIAFYYSDSLKTGFKYFKNEDDRLTKKGKAFENELMSRQRALEGLQARFQERYQQGTASPEEMMNLENEIKRKNQQLLQFQQNQGGALEKETSESLTSLSKKIEAAGKKYCEKYKSDI
jgi:Skp family chaperone for outer membrane proteins